MSDPIHDVPIHDVVRGIAVAIQDASAKDPDLHVTVETSEGRIDVLPFRHGVTEPSRSWRGDAEWAALIVYLGDTATPELYVIPGADFDEDARHNGSILHHEDYRGPLEPGVLWVDMEGPAYETRHARLTNYRIT